VTPQVEYVVTIQVRRSVVRPGVLGTPTPPRIENLTSVTVTRPNYDRAAELVIDHLNGLGRDLARDGGEE
jgi:hypothetical protein